MTTPSRGRGRPRTGTVEPHDDHWDVRATLADGTRAPRRCLPPGTSKARAKEIAASMTEIDAASPRPAEPAPVPAGESFADWAERWCVSREKRGLTTVDDDRGRLRKWINPTLGAKPIESIVRLDVERLVERLDDAVIASELHWKTATNVWGLVSKAFNDAVGAKSISIRVLSTNPALGVRGPDRGTKKAKTYMHPAEFLTLVSCASIPMIWRRMYVVTTYLYLRAAEARALEWADVDLDQAIALIHQTDDGEVAGSTKSDRARRVRIEPTLLPMLRAMRESAGGVGRVLVAMPVEKHLAPMLRDHLDDAGLTRADLTTNDATRKRLTFQDLRATGLTWRAVRGDDITKVMRAAGHVDLATTQGYIREAEGYGSGYGEVFPELPMDLVLPGILPERVGANGHVYGIVRQKASGRRDLNPRLDVGLAQIRAVLPHGSSFARCSSDDVSCANAVAKSANPGRWAELPGRNQEPDLDGARALAMLGRQVLATSSIWDALDAALFDDDQALERQPSPT